MPGWATCRLSEFRRATRVTSRATARRRRHVRAGTDVRAAEPSPRRARGGRRRGGGRGAARPAHAGRGPALAAWLAARRPGSARHAAAHPRGARLLRDAMAAQRRTLPAPVPAWFDEQLTETGARWDDDAGWLDRRADGDRITALRDAVDAIVLVAGLPPIAALRPPLRRSAGIALAAATPSGSRMLDRVRALLAKAESTGYPAEAEAFTAKAQELMARHSIDAALLDAGPTGPAARVGCGSASTPRTRPRRRC
ncbi:DUF2786 domain-containing protein [Micromonospora sp. BRA006-A]|nr:DUF2786 domain-containing protein [Micromonospora sp. BRA006-A]